MIHAAMLNAFSPSESQNSSKESEMGAGRGEGKGCREGQGLWMEKGGSGNELSDGWCPSPSLLLPAEISPSRKRFTKIFPPHSALLIGQATP